MNVDMEISLELQEICQKLNSNQLQHLIQWLTIRNSGTGVARELYFEALDKLNTNYEFLSVEDVQTIITIAKKL